MMKSSNKIVRYSAMFTLICVMLVGFAAVSFSKPVVADEVTAAQAASHYVPADAMLEKVSDNGDSYTAHFAADEAGMSMLYDVTIDKSTQEVSNMQMNVNGVKATSASYQD